MRFRPCIDIHNGKVKQIVGGSLRDEADTARENFVSQQDASWYADLYRRHRLSGGHVILLNSQDSPYYRQTCDQARAALAAWPGGLQVGGGVTPENAAGWLDAGASHVIVTSYVFRDGQIRWDRLQKLQSAVGSGRLVLDLSCRRQGDRYMVVTDRWQKMTDTAVTAELIDALRGCCAELLVHGVDAEGKAGGIERDLAVLLGTLADRIPVTYAGGIGSLADLQQLRFLTGGKVDYTIGSALDLFGGTIPFSACLEEEKDR